MVKAKAIIYILNVCRIIKSGRYVTTKNSPPPSPPSFFILYFFFHVLILFLPYYLNMFFGVLSLSLLLYFSHIISSSPPSIHARVRCVPLLRRDPSSQLPEAFVKYWLFHLWTVHVSDGSSGRSFSLTSSEYSWCWVTNLQTCNYSQRIWKISEQISFPELYVEQVAIRSKIQLGKSETQRVRHWFAWVERVNATQTEGAKEATPFVWAHQ